MTRLAVAIISSCQRQILARTEGRPGSLSVLAVLAKSEPRKVYCPSETIVCLHWEALETQVNLAQGRHKNKKLLWVSFFSIMCTIFGQNNDATNQEMDSFYCKRKKTFRNNCCYLSLSEKWSVNLQNSLSQRKTFFFLINIYPKYKFNTKWI